MTSVGKKIWVALTGIGLSGFVFMHMIGNLLILVGPDIYNEYSYKLVSNPLIYVAEAGLLALFLVHVFFALCLTRGNKIARPIAPSLNATTCAKAARFGSKYMALTGILTLAFVVFHLYSFKFGTEYKTQIHGVEVRDLHRLVIEKFHDPLYLGLYLVCLLLLGVHLSHGVGALFQTLGLSSVRQCAVKKLSWGFAILVSGGFILEAIYSYFYQGGH